MGYFYITTPIYYVNGTPHIGHLYTTLVADMLTRYHTLKNEKTFFLTGTDEHGTKIAEAAQKQNTTPQALADSTAQNFKQLWERSTIEYSRFIRTTEEQHTTFVQMVLQKLYEQGDIYFADYEGLYCTGCERFYTESELIDGICPQHAVPPVHMKEGNYFFKMSKYTNWLIDHIVSNPTWIEPEQYRNEVLSMLRSSVIEDLCISRPVTRLQWGIPLPFDAEYVCYVWFDALLNYLSGIDYPITSELTSTDSTAHALWNNAVLLIAKDIVKPHAVFFPCMLKAMGIPLFHKLKVHGYWLVRDTKLSKSLGNAVDPNILLTQYGTDAIRYFLLREMHYGVDANFSEELLIERSITELANDIGNLFSRTLGMAAKYAMQTLNEHPTYTQEDTTVIETLQHALQTYCVMCDAVAPHKAIQAVLTMVSTLNKYIDTVAPWKLYKEKQQERLQTVLYLLCEGLRKIALTLYPVIPTTAIRMFTLLGYTKDDILATSAKTHLSSNAIASFEEECTHWGRLHNTTLAKPTALFPREQWESMQHDVIQGGHMQTTEQQTQSTLQDVTGSGCLSPDSYINYEDFTKIVLQVGTVREAHKVPNADKLLRLLVDIGENEPRQILAGIAEFYMPEHLINSQVVVVTNLKPRTLRGFTSYGMLLAIKYDATLCLVRPENTVPPGSHIS